MQDLDAPGELTGSLTGTTRRRFIRGVAAAGVSTVASYGLARAAGADLFEASAFATGSTPFSEFTAIAASAGDRLEAPEGFRADVVIAWGDAFADDRGNTFTYGFNNDFLAFFPLKGPNEGLLFVNHEYAGPFYQHGYKPTAEAVAAGKTAEQVEIERASVGNSIVHVKRDHEGVWKVVSPSRYNRRVYGGVVTNAPRAEGSLFAVTGPLAGHPRVGYEIAGSLGNCSGGTTPWGTVLSCEENFDGYGLPLEEGNDSASGWVEAGFPQYDPGTPYREDSANAYAWYGWVCEHDPYDPSSKPRKHTALGRFRHENTAFRHVPGKRFVLYMGDDKANEGVYKFVSDGEFKPGVRGGTNKDLLAAGTLYIARWEPGGRREFATAGDTTPISATSGTGTWVEVLGEELIDTATLLRERFGDEYDAHFATNRPEDVEVEEGTGHVYIAFTNNSSVKDVHGAIRRLVEDGNDPEAVSFAWEDFAEGGPSGRGEEGEQGFSCCDNLVFDAKGDLWVVTDISSSTLNDEGPLQYHANNAVFHIPTSGPNAGIAYRFANMPSEAEGTGPYFTPDGHTLFVNVQHPGEIANSDDSDSVFGQPETYTSYWPDGDRSESRNPSLPKPSTVAITRLPKAEPGLNVIPRPA
jgi:secreted PhoX family phosphatase